MLLLLLAQLALESTRLFDETYGLSYAQQLKNKDIPEGGAKGYYYYCCYYYNYYFYLFLLLLLGVILVNTPSIDPNRKFFAMRKSVKGENCFIPIIKIIIITTIKTIIITTTKTNTSTITTTITKTTTSFHGFHA